MKNWKRLVRLVLMSVCVLLALEGLSAKEARALRATAGTVTSFSDALVGESGVRVWQVNYTTHASAGTFTAITDTDITGWILLVETDPGSTAPDDNYDITLKNVNGRDIMGGSLTDRDTSNTEAALPLQNGNYTAVFNEGTLAIAVTAAGNSKTAEIFIYYLP